MARVRIEGAELTVRLSLLEKLLALRGSVTVPLSSVESVQVIERPLSKKPLQSVRMGVAAAGSPFSKLATIGPRATFEDGKALIVIWRNSRSLILELREGAGEWRLIAVSGRTVDQVAEQLRRRT